jgi:muramoyltetrapeptide carboxypeptidase
MRRQLLSAIGASTLGGCTQLSPIAAPRYGDLIKPPKLQIGQTVGLFAPGGYVTPQQIQLAKDNMQKLGFEVKLAKHLEARWGGYAGTIEQRAESFHDLYFDNSVSALWAVRGGSGTIGILPELQYAKMAKNPKAIIGYSDITALHLALLAKANMISFHAPVASSSFLPFTVACLQAVLMKPQNGLTLNLFDDHRLGATSLQSGVAKGRLIGGNLSLVSALTGTSFLPPLDNALLFLEDTAEPPYKIDRMLHQLFLHCPANRLAGLLLGIFSKSDPPDADPSLTLQQVIQNHIARAALPSSYGLSFGHIAPQWTLPVGAMARFDSAAGSITLLEAVVTN